MSNTTHHLTRTDVEPMFTVTLSYIHIITRKTYELRVTLSDDDPQYVATNMGWEAMRERLGPDVEYLRGSIVSIVETNN